MSRYSRYAQAAACLPVLGLVFFLPPYIKIFDQHSWFVGLPGLPLSIFLLWTIGIILTAFIARRLSVGMDKSAKRETKPRIPPTDKTGA